jgi:hypothetical protein
LIDRCISEEYNDIITRLRAGSRDFSDLTALNMLNTKYLLAGNTRNHVLENEHALGNAWLVNNVVTVNNPDEEILTTCETDPAQMAVVDVSRFPMSRTSFNAEGTVQLVEYEPNQLTYQAQLSDEAFVVFSEVYYPKGWQVTVNGEEADHIRANYILRAMVLPAGNHTIEFTFRPQSYVVGNTVMLISSAIILLIFIGAIAFEVRRRIRVA